MTCVWLAFYARRGHLRRNIPFCLVSESPAPATPTQARPLRPLCLPRPAAPHHKLEPSPGVRAPVAMETIHLQWLFHCPDAKCSLRADPVHLRQI